MRVPLVYQTNEILNWHIVEEYLPGKWRLARCCGFWNFCHIKQQFRIAWRVFIGRYDALNWGETSGELTSTERNYLTRPLPNKSLTISTE